MNKLVYIHANTRLVDKINDVEYEEQYVDWQNDSKSDSDDDSGSDTDHSVSDTA